MDVELAPFEFGRAFGGGDRSAAAQFASDQGPEPHDASLQFATQDTHVLHARQQAVDLRGREESGAMCAPEDGGEGGDFREVFRAGGFDDNAHRSGLRSVFHLPHVRSDAHEDHGHRKHQPGIEVEFLRPTGFHETRVQIGEERDEEVAARDGQQP